MMKHMKIVKVPETTKKIVDLITCDLCGKKIEERNYDISEVEVRHKKGKLYQDSGSGTETCFDLCCNCFDEKLVPWLRSQGAEPRIVEWDF